MSDEQGFERVIKRLEDQVAEQAQEIKRLRELLHDQASQTAFSAKEYTGNMDALRAKLRTVTDIAERQSAMLGAWMANIPDADAAMKADTKVLQIEFSRLVDKIEPFTHDEAPELLEEAKWIADQTKNTDFVDITHRARSLAEWCTRRDRWINRYQQYKESKA
jgi:hypothetical protein